MKDIESIKSYLNQGENVWVFWTFKGFSNNFRELEMSILPVIKLWFWVTKEFRFIKL